MEGIFFPSMGSAFCQSPQLSDRGTVVLGHGGEGSGRYAAFSLSSLSLLPLMSSSSGKSSSLSDPWDPLRVGMHEGASLGSGRRGGCS